jgi:hypothetical protein
MDELVKIDWEKFLTNLSVYCCICVLVHAGIVIFMFFFWVYHNTGTTVHRLVRKLLVVYTGLAFYALLLPGYILFWNNDDQWFTTTACPTKQKLFAAPSCTSTIDREELKLHSVTMVKWKNIQGCEKVLQHTKIGRKSALI